MTRPKFKGDFPQLYDSDAFQKGREHEFENDVEIIKDEDTLKDLMNRSDTSFNGVAASNAINFNPSFGKICMGEHFKVLFTIQNNSASYSLEEIKLKVFYVRNVKAPANQASGAVPP